MNWSSILKDQLKVQYPVIQAPMLGVTTPAMVAGVSNAGGLGSLPIGGLSKEESSQLISATRRLTQQPFAVNLFMHTLPASTAAEINTMKTLLTAIAGKYGINDEALISEEAPFYTYHDQLSLLLEQHVNIVSFTFGIPDDASIRLLKDAGVYLIGTATCVEEALILEQKGINAIVAQGIEAGGHRGSFLPGSPLPQVGSMALIPEITDHVSVPVIAAGAIADARSIMAAHILGAQGFQPGSIFLRCAESKAAQPYKDAVQRSRDTATQLTNVFTGRWARGISNDFMQTVAAAGIKIPPYPVQNMLTTTLRKHAAAANKSELLSLWAGQRAAIATDKTAKAIFEQLIADMEALAKKG
ncbi:NAD(P)H-dependent flavin oxidoreductase [Chitinophaga defluvii]|uniref:Propionate 3-nitronate monooxygenase n=1 Tax=Chitinophaga defluvii TaxID=3163343 RepID=A0ABV2T2B2_9BACT